jgi:SulP family sulfate permease
VRLINIKEITAIWASAGADRYIMLVTLVATLTIPLEFAVLLGIFLSIACYLYQTSRPRIRSILPDKKFRYLLPAHEKQECPQLGVIEILGDLYFGAVNHVEDYIYSHLEDHPRQRYLLLRMHSVENFDISGVHALKRLVEVYREKHGDVYFGWIRDPVMDVMRGSGFAEFMGEDHFLERDSDAIGKLFHRVLDPAICIYECPVRAFYECQDLPKRLDLIGAVPGFDVSNIEFPTLTSIQLWKDLHSDNPPQVIDVREPREFQQGHIINSRDIPMPDILKQPDLIPQDGRVVLVCRSGRRSSRLVCFLSDEGWDNLVILEGGILAWEKANLIEAL